MDLNYEFRDQSLKDVAFRHPSSIIKNNGCESYERMEFLGDSILEAAIRHYLFGRHKNMCEGNMSKIKAFLTKQSTISVIR